MGFRILLVDDNEAYTDSLKDILEDEGYEVVTASRGEHACALTQADHFDLVLMDIKMPGMNGVECFLRMKHVNPSVRVILFTAYALTDLVKKAEENGVLAVLKKPLNMDKLHGIIEATLAQPAGGCILVADDDQALCENLYDALTASGYRVATACGARAAIREAQHRAFDIFLLDLKMPELNGLEVYRRVKQLQPNLVTILMTGYAEEMSDLIQQAMDESAYTTLAKPIDVEALLVLLNRVVEDRKRGTLRKPDGE